MRYDYTRKGNNIMAHLKDMTGEQMKIKTDAILNNLPEHDKEYMMELIMFSNHAGKMQGKLSMVKSFIYMIAMIGVGILIRTIFF